MKTKEPLAMRPGKEFDAWIALKVFGMTRSMYLHPKEYSTDISASWEVVEKVCSDDYYNWSFGMEYSTVIDWVVDFTPRRNHPKAREYPAYQATASTAPMAICKAALMVLANEGE
jgi:hypothetical protein